MFIWRRVADGVDTGGGPCPSARGGGVVVQDRDATGPPPPRSVLASLHGSRAVLGWHDRPPDPLIVHCYPSFAATSLQITNPQTALCLSPRLDPARGRANTEAISLTSSLPLPYLITDSHPFYGFSYPFLTVTTPPCPWWTTSRNQLKDH